MGNILKRNLIESFKNKTKQRKVAVYIHNKPDDINYSEMAIQDNSKKMEEIAERQRLAVNHVVENLFPYAPVKIQLQKYPSTSKKKGQAYLWLTLDEEIIKLKGGGQSVTRYPAGVAVDMDGNVYVLDPTISDLPKKSELSKTSSSTGSSSPPRKITVQSILDLATTNEVPMRLQPPKLLKAEMNSLTVYWKEPKETLIDRFEVQYRSFSLNKDINNSWFALANAVTIREICLNEIPCYTPYEFRVRAHNPAGWGEYSESSEVFWTLPGPPEVLRPPFATLISSHYICLYWDPAKENGSNIISYTIQMKNITSSTYETIYVGTECTCLATCLIPLTHYYIRLQAKNEIGLSKWIEIPNAIRTIVSSSKPEIQDILMDENTDTTNNKRWLTCWDPKTEQIFYFNRYTGQRTIIEPEEVLQARENKDEKSPENSIEMIFRKKRFHFIRELHVRHGERKVTGTKDIVMEVNRSNLYNDSFHKFQRLNKDDLFNKFKIVYENESGIDSGGLLKDWYLQMSKQFIENDRYLFNTNYKINSNSIFINSNSFLNKDHLKEFRFLGKFIAKAIYDRQTLDLPFENIIFKHILGIPIIFDDLKDMDPIYYKSLNWILQNNIENIIFETFSIIKNVGKDKIIVDLIENGRNIDVTNKNKEEYVKYVVQWITEYEIRQQLDAMLQGMYSFIPFEKLAIFSLDELKLLINGKNHIDIDEIRASLVFQGGYDECSQVVLWLWQALRECNQEYRGLFLKFVTGSTSIPLDGFDPPLNITKSDLDNKALPRSHTCFNQFVLPDYNDYNILVDKLMFAIMNTEGFELS